MPEQKIEVGGQARSPSSSPSDLRFCSFDPSIDEILPSLISAESPDNTEDTILSLLVTPCLAILKDHQWFLDVSVALNEGLWDSERLLRTVLRRL